MIVHCLARLDGLFLNERTNIYIIKDLYFENERHPVASVFITNSSSLLLVATMLLLLLVLPLRLLSYLLFFNLSV
jgi:hypothetical protein